MIEQIEVVGLTTTTVSNGVQYTILTKTGDTYYDYVFMPLAGDKFILRITPTVDKTIESKPLQPAVLEWNGSILNLRCGASYMLYNNITRILANPTPLFEREEEMLPKRWAMIIRDHPEAIMSFIATGKSVVYADDWEHLPSVIPEDIIVLNVKKFPVSEIVLHLPQRTKAVVLLPEIFE